MKCHRCEKEMKRRERMRFNEYEVSGWECSCGEQIFDSEQAQKVLLLNQLKNQEIKAKLGKNRSNLILRLPKDIEQAFGFEKGEEVTLKVEDECIKVLPA